MPSIRRLLLLAALAAAGLAQPLRAEPYPDRLVWVFGWGLGKDSDVAEVTALLEDAAKHGLTGAVVSAGLDSMSRQSPDYFRRLDQVSQACRRLNLELIPAVFSVGYGGSALGANRMLAEGVPVQDAPFLVQGREARLVPGPAPLANGGFEEYTGSRLRGFAFHDQPGEISFVDTQVKHGGAAALRMENFTANPHGHGRVMQKVRVQPHRVYRLSLWVRTEGLQPASAFRLTVLAGKRELAPRTFKVAATSDWQRFTTLVNSLDCDSVNVYAGMWGGKAGKLWLDDLTLEEVGPLNVLRRPGTPVTVRSADGATTYTEGRDYAPLEDPRFNFRAVDRDAPPLRLLPGGRIQDGQRLQVSWYHPMVIHESQITLCMGEPQLYEIFAREAKLLSERLRPKRVLLNMDEVRMGGTCQACRGRDLGEALGACISKQVQILRQHNPGVQVAIWSDMLDPHHNARADYYLCQGSYAGSWKHVPKDLTIAVWGGAPREKSLRFFADEGFATLVACYYDANDLKDVKGWLQAAAPLPRVRGFMYTPWQKKYQLLGEFGDLLQQGR